MLDNSSPSVLSLVAAALYVAIALVCFFAAKPQASGPSGDGVQGFWVVIGIAFVVFAAMRVLSAEDLARDYLRELIAEQGMRDARRNLQAVIVVAVGLFAIALTAWSVLCLRKNWPDREARLRFIAGLSVGNIVVLIIVRIVSLHFTDWLLFSGIIGPIRLNWMIDLAASVVVLMSAAMSINLGGKAQQRPHRSVSNFRR